MYQVVETIFNCFNELVVKLGQIYIFNLNGLSISLLQLILFMFVLNLIVDIALIVVTPMPYTKLHTILGKSVLKRFRRK